MTEQQNVNTQDEYDRRAIAQANEISKDIAFLGAKAEYKGAMIWISKIGANSITNTLLEHVKEMGYTLNSVSVMYDNRLYALFNVNESKKDSSDIE